MKTKNPIRVVMAKPGLDGHDRGIKILARSFQENGMEVIYLGLRQTPEMIINAAIQEDADVIAISVLSGAHMTYFKEIKVFTILENTGLEILRALALHLNLKETYFDKKVQGGNSILRAIHYPPITTEPKGAVRAAAHGDINLITILMGASASGLEVQNRKGEWIPVTALPHQVVVNNGDMMSRFTNNKLHNQNIIIIIIY